ncbi:MAG: DUF58 domain-containing protein [Gammaproteobacteria bacterium]|nr:MAG: DUF58 domain-containing protein [Gammaproteobacteria bacterium]
MHLAQRAFALLLLTAVLAITGIWSSEPGFSELWRIPAGVLLIGLAFEAALLRKAPLTVGIETAPWAFLGREQPAAFAFGNESRRALTVEYAPVVPAGFEPQTRVRRVTVPARGSVRDSVALVPIHLGPQSWPALAAPRGNPAGARSRRVMGAGSELHQLRGYLYGDPLARIDWKATARARELVTREFSEDQHLDILVAIDAGRFSRVRVGRLDRFGMYANVAARFAELVTPNDDRIGLLVFSDQPLVACPPGRGLPAVTRLRRTLEQVSVRPAESDPTAAAVRIRAMLRHRSLVVMLTDLDDANVADQLARAVRLLSPPHLVVVAGVQSGEIAELARREARDWSDPWVALAAQEHEARASAQRLLLRRLGAPVIATRAELLEQAVLAEYEALRRSRRV